MAVIKKRHNSDKQQGMMLVIIFLFIMIALLVVITFIELYRSCRIIVQRNYQIIKNIDIAYESIRELINRQNNDKMYIFTSKHYETQANNCATLKSIAISNTAGEIAGKSTIMLCPNPLKKITDSYKLQVTTIVYPSRTKKVYFAEMERLSFLDYQYYSDNSMEVADNIFAGAVYSPFIKLGREGIQFWNRVEYVTGIEQGQLGQFNYGVTKLPQPYPSLESLINFQKFKDSSQQSGVCDEGIGFYIGTEGFPEYVALVNELFRKGDGKYAMDLRKLVCDNTTDFIAYNGVRLPRYDFSTASFNGIIYVDGELYIEEHKGNEKIVLYDAEPGCDLLVVSKPGSRIYIGDNIGISVPSTEKNRKVFLISGRIFHVMVPAVHTINASLLAAGKEAEISLYVNSLNNFLEFSTTFCLCVFVPLCLPNIIENFKYIWLDIKGNMVLRGSIGYKDNAGELQTIRLMYDDELQRRHINCYPALPVWRLKKGTYFHAFAGNNL